MKKLIYLLSFALIGLSQATLAQTQDIVGVAASNDDFSTLVTAVKAADLVEALKGEGPLTVFAPTNSSFAKIDDATLASLLKPENKEKLAAILTYHVVAGKLEASDVAAALRKGKGVVELKTLNGATLTVMGGRGGIYLKDANGNKSKITATDVMASNGVIHVIENVVMPK